MVTSQMITLPTIAPSIIFWNPHPHPENEARRHQGADHGRVGDDAGQQGDRRIGLDADAECQVVGRRAQELIAEAVEAQPDGDQPDDHAADDRAQHAPGVRPFHRLDLAADGNREGRADQRQERPVGHQPGFLPVGAAVPAFAPALLAARSDHRIVGAALSQGRAYDGVEAGHEIRMGIRDQRRNQDQRSDQGAGEDDLLDRQIEFHARGQHGPREDQDARADNEQGPGLHHPGAEVLPGGAAAQNSDQRERGRQAQVKDPIGRDGAIEQPGNDLHQTQRERQERRQTARAEHVYAARARQRNRPCDQPEGNASHDDTSQNARPQKIAAGIERRPVKQDAGDAETDAHQPDVVDKGVSGAGRPDEARGLAKKDPLLATNVCHVSDPFPVSATGAAPLIPASVVRLRPRRPGGSPRRLAGFPPDKRCRD